jgi:hypothetical protein
MMNLERMFLDLVIGDSHTNTSSLTRYFNPEVDVYLPSSGDSIRGWTMRTFEANKQAIIEDLQQALSKVHLTVDLWSSGNRKSVLVVIGHYISASGELKHNVLAVREMQGEHTGENQARVVSKVLVDFGIELKIGYFVGDNATNNNTLCASLSRCVFFLSSY